MFNLREINVYLTKNVKLVEKNQHQSFLNILSNRKSFIFAIFIEDRLII